MTYMSKTFKNAVLAGCCSLGMGLGYAQSPKAANNPVSDILSHPTLRNVPVTTVEVSRFDAALMMDGRSTDLLEEYEFIDPKILKETVDRLLSVYCYPQKQKKPVIRYVKDFDETKEKIFQLDTTRKNAVTTRDLNVFFVRDVLKQAYSQDKSVIRVAADRGHYIYDGRFLDSLAVAQDRFNEVMDSKVDLLVATTSGVQALAIVNDQWSTRSKHKKEKKTGQLVMYGDLLAELDYPEALAVQGHEFGHFQYALLESRNGQYRALHKLLRKFGYNKEAIKHMDNYGEELFADIYAVQMIVGKYGKNAENYMRDALIKLSVRDIEEELYEEELKNTDDPHNALEIKMQGHVLQYLYQEKQIRKYFEEQKDDVTKDPKEGATESRKIVHPHLLVRLDVIDKAFKYYMQK